MRSIFPRGLAVAVLLANSLPVEAGELIGEVIDSVTRKPIPARVYVEDSDGKAWFVSSGAANGSAIAYQEQWVPMAGSVERHTTISADGFRAELPPGNYTVRIERGKEYLPLAAEVTVGEQATRQTFPLVRWIDMVERGWYSGETHVHRRLSELPNVMRAEQLNVAFPVTFWTIAAEQPPDLKPSPLRSQGPSPFGPREDVGAMPLRLDDECLIFPRNTEYEIFSVGGRPHTLGAMFLLNHRSVLSQTAPPVAAIARQARDEGALIDLDKHSWPWSMMLVAVAGVDLFELSNNSVWRTQFGFGQINQPLPPWATFETAGPESLTEWGWLNYGFEVYYALLNCGFRLTPTAGTASGVHPVPLGYSRVYVKTGQPLDPERWLRGLRDGNSFVTTGPMLMVQVDGQDAGQDRVFDGKSSPTVRVEIESVSVSPLSAIEILVNGEVVRTLKPQPERTPEGAWKVRATESILIDETSWLAVRSIEPQPDGRRRFAHTAPWHFRLGDQPIRPRAEQVEYFIALMESEVERNRAVLSPDGLAEFEQALEVYRRLLPR